MPCFRNPFPDLQKQLENENALSESEKAAPVKGKPP
jgi:hypothetical protein